MIKFEYLITFDFNSNKLFRINFILYFRNKHDKADIDFTLSVNEELM